MRRRYLTALYRDRVATIKKLMPDCCIGVDVIVGFPGETEEDFLETYSFLATLPVSYFHVFTYSEREDTLAATFKEVVPISTRQLRNKKLRALSYEKQQKFEQEQQGQMRPVLFEKQERGDQMEGYTDNYIRITTPYRADWVNKIIEWRI